MAIRLITAPSVEPVALDLAKSHLRVDHSYDDLLIAAYIEGARLFAEKFCGRALVTQTWELVLDEFPRDSLRSSTLPLGPFIDVPLPPLQSVTSIKYDDAAGVEQTLATNAYTVDTVSEPGRVAPVTSWPSGVISRIGAVRVRFVAGYSPSTDSPPDLAANVPESIKNAILLHTGMLYAQRESNVIATIVNQVPAGGILHLLRQYRVALGMA